CGMMVVGNNHRGTRCGQKSLAGSMSERDSVTQFDGYLLTMSTHTVAEAKNQLSKLIDRALKGEGIVITRRGQPVVELKPVQSVPRPLETDAGTVVSEMRDEAEKGAFILTRALSSLCLSSTRRALAPRLFWRHVPGNP